MKKKKLLIAVSVGFLMSSLSSVADATLLGRFALTPGGTDFQAYYDDNSDLTWLADANAGLGSSFDNGFSASDGRMTWQNANDWAANLNIAGSDNWRLPYSKQPDANCTGQSSGGTVSTGFNCTGSEMGDLFYNKGISAISPGPFENIQINNYWSGTEFILDANRAWGFHLNSGNQSTGNKAANLYVWAVHPGDVGKVTTSVSVTEPSLLWLLGTGMLGLFGVTGIKKRHLK